MRALLQIGAAVAFSACASAEDLKVEALVLDLPNAAADKLVAEGISGDIAPWKALVGADGSVKEGSGAKVVARFKATDFKEGRGTQQIKHEAPNDLVDSFYYQVDAKDTEASTRRIVISLRLKQERTFPLKNWSIGLSSSLTTEWSFSARHRSKESSRIVLEKATVLPGFEKAESAKLAFRMMERSKVVPKREQKMETAQFTADPDEFYRIEWRFRKGAETQFSHESTTSLDFGKSVIDLNEGASTYGPEGERAYFNRKAGGYTSNVSFERQLDPKGKKTRLQRSEVSRSNYEIDPAPVAMRRAAKEVVMEYKGRVGEGKEQSSRIVSEFIAD
jgi:hypothetical protein